MTNRLVRCDPPRRPSASPQLGPICCKVDGVHLPNARTILLPAVRTTSDGVDSRLKSPWSVPHPQRTSRRARSTSTTCFSPVRSAHVFPLRRARPDGESSYLANYALISGGLVAASVSGRVLQRLSSACDAVDRSSDLTTLKFHQCSITGIARMAGYCPPVNSRCLPSFTESVWPESKGAGVPTLDNESQGRAGLEPCARWPDLDVCRDDFMPTMKSSRVFWRTGHKPPVDRPSTFTILGVACNPEPSNDPLVLRRVREADPSVVPTSLVRRCPRRESSTRFHGRWRVLGPVKSSG